MHDYATNFLILLNGDNAIKLGLKLSYFLFDQIFFNLMHIEVSLNDTNASLHKMIRYFE